MMISLVICLIFAWAFYIGYSRGIILQAFYSLSSLLSLFIAASQYKGLAKLYTQWVPFANATEGASTFYFQSKYLTDFNRSLSKDTKKQNQPIAMRAKERGKR